MKLILIVLFLWYCRFWCFITILIYYISTPNPTLMVKLNFYITEEHVLHDVLHIYPILCIVSGTYLIKISREFFLFLMHR